MSKGRAAKLLVLAGFVAVAVAVAAYRRWAGPPQVGHAAPDFALPTLAGEEIRLSGLRPKVVVVNFWATWCPPCIEETPSLRRFSEILRDEGVIVVGVSVDEDPEVLRKFVAQYELSFPIARDPNRTVAARYGTFKFPETYIIDRSGRIAEKIVNAVDWEDARIVEFVRGLARAGAR
jgi:peroxiredoxin